MVTTGHDHDKLLSASLVNHWRRLPARGELVRPDGFAGFQVDGTNEIIGRGCDEDQSARCGDRTAVIRRSDFERKHRGDAERSVALRRTERMIPQGLAGREVNGANAAIGWLLAEDAGWHLPALIGGNPIRQIGLRTIISGTRTFVARVSEVEDAKFIVHRAGHERRITWKFVVIEHDHAAPNVDRKTAPIRAAVISGVLDPRLIHAWGSEYALIMRRSKLDAA